MDFHLFMSSLMDIIGGHELCFPNINSSCRRLPQPHSQTALLSSLLTFISLLTVMLNLLVITSISHFRQLHTPTNALISHTSGTVDFFVSFIVPCTVMIILYIRVFVVAASHLRAIRLQTAAATTSKASDRKAARTLGIVIAVYLLCYCPYFFPTLAGEDTLKNLWYFPVLSWFGLASSLMNPLIYALFYPWFRKAIKLIFNLRILQPHSREAKLL